MLLDRINEDAKNLKGTENKLYDSISRYLRVATLGRINDLKIEKMPCLIINLGLYFNTLEESLKGLTTKHKKHSQFKDIVSKFEMIKEEKEYYTSDLNKKIKDAMVLIEINIKPELDKIGKEFDENIESLSKEVVKLINENKKNEFELKKKKRDLGNAMVMRALLGFSSVVDMVLCLLGPAGIVVGTSISAVSAISQSFVDENLYCQI